MAEVLSNKRRQILDFIASFLRDNGYPPSVREIGEAVGLASSATVHSHIAVLHREGYLEKDPTKPRAMKVNYDAGAPAVMATGKVRHIPLVGDVAAGSGVLAQENIEELVSMPDQFIGSGDHFMLRVRGESMIEAGIFDGDYVVVRHQPDADNGDIVVAGINDDEATIKRLSKTAASIVLIPANPALSPIEYDPADVTIFGRVVTVIRSL